MDTAREGWGYELPSAPFAGQRHVQASSARHYWERGEGRVLLSLLEKCSFPAATRLFLPLVVLWHSPAACSPPCR